MVDITKEFPGVKALSHVSLSVRRDAIHAICGENGAGKSTLMKVLSGVHPYGSYTGRILFDGRECEFRDIRSSEQAGIGIIHQELALIPELSITENIFLGNEPTRFGVIDWDRARAAAFDLLRRVGLREEPDTKIKDLGVGKQQLVEIAKAMAESVKLLILDEPTAALNESDSQHLLGLMTQLRDSGVTCIIISHKLNELEQIADAITILRDGHTIETLDVASGDIDEDRIIRGMVGRSLESRFPDHTPQIGDVMFEVRDWTVKHPSVSDRLVCKSENFFVRRGEIVGFAGLMGAGRTELARSLFGRSYGTYVRGTILKDGREVTLRTISEAIDAGLAYVTEDRKSLGLIALIVFFQIWTGGLTLTSDNVINLFNGNAYILILAIGNDANAKVFFDGAMDVLAPKIDDGTLKVVSGQKDFNQVVTQGWKAENAQKRMDTLLAGTYTKAKLDGVLSPNDTLARAILTSVKSASKPTPVVTGQDSEVESVKSIMAGEQYSTINKDTRDLVTQAVKMVSSLQAGQEPEINDTEQYNNGVKVVPAYLLKPVIVTKDNAAEAYANDPTLEPITKQ